MLDRSLLLQFVGKNFNIEKEQGWIEFLGTCMLSCSYLDLAPCYKILADLKTNSASFSLYDFVRVGNPTLFWRLLFHDCLQLALDTKNYEFLARMNYDGLAVEQIPHQYRNQHGLLISDKHRDELLSATNDSNSSRLFSLVNVISLFDIPASLVLKTLRPYLELPLVSENLALIGTVLECCSVKANIELEGLYEKSVDSYLSACSNNLNVLRGFLRLVDSLPASYLTTNRLEIVYKLLERNLGSFNHDIRQTTFEILLRYQQPCFPASNEIFNGPSIVFKF